MPARLAVAPRRAQIVVAGVAFLAGAVALYLRLGVFDLGSANNDEGVYLRQARALADGHLTVPFTGPPEAHQPWLFAIGPDGYISKYLPVAAAFYALGILLFGSVTPILVALSVALPVLTYLLGRTTALSPGRSAAAAAIVGLSPAMLAQGGLLLSYLPLLVLVLTCWIAAFRSADAGSSRWAAAAAFFGALTVLTRPLDGLLLVAPVLLWLLWRSTARRPTLFALLGGGGPVALGMLAYNSHVTGSATKLPFSVLEPMDKPGFGERKFFPESAGADFGLPQALDGTTRHFFLEPMQWMVGFLAVLALALWAVRRGGSAGERHRVLVGSAGLLLAAYFFFWGPWHASVVWGGTRTIGPFYSLALFPSLVLAALTVPLRTRVLVAALAATSVHPAVNAVNAYDRAERDDRISHDLMALIDPSVTTLLEVEPPYTAHPVTAMDGEGIVLSSQLPPSAMPAGPKRILALDGYSYRRGFAPEFEVREPVLTSGQSVRLDVRRTGYSARELLIVSHRGVATACRQGAGVTLTLTREGVTGCSGEQVPARWADFPDRACPDASCLNLSTLTPLKTGKWGVGAWRRIPLDDAAGRLSLITDGRVLRTSGSGWISVVAR
ncbi:MAG: hypothetical protein ACT4QF_11715 [Sporichthyaceae bacterium]